MIKYFLNRNYRKHAKSIDNTIRENSKFALEVSLRLQRYSIKDWGNLHIEDIKQNNYALNNPDNLYLMGAYDTCKGKIWIITERISETHGDNTTIVLFPDER